MTHGPRRWLVVVATLLLTASAGEAWAFWTAPGAGQATVASGSLVAATLATPAAAANAITVTWTEQASLTPSSSANSSITYAVQRRLGSGTYAAVPGGGCSGVKAYGITTCTDAPGAAGSYSYRVVASFATWTATSAASGPVAFLIDATAPTVLSIDRVGATPTNLTGVSWTVTFSESVTGVSSADFALAASGPTAASITAVTGSGTTYTVTASTGAGSGTLGLNLVDDDSITDAAANELGGTGTANGNLTGQTYTIDKTPPTAPSAIAATSGVVWGTASCSVATGTRYINGTGTSASASTVALTATVTPETGLTIVFSATSGATNVTSSALAATASPVTTTQNLGTLIDGTITLTAYTVDAAGNASTITTSTAILIKDTAVPALTATYSDGLAGLDPKITGASECGATVTAVRTGGGNLGATYTMTIGSGTSYTLAVQGSLLGLGTVAYAVTATDRAGNVSATRNTSG